MVWHREYDETYETHYYYNDADGTSSWEQPADYEEDDGVSLTSAFRIAECE